MTITITVNGQERALEGPVPLTDFLRGLGVRAAFMAVARNGEVLRKEEHADVTILDGDVLELVRPVGGGAPTGLLGSPSHPRQAVRWHHSS